MHFEAQASEEEMTQLLARFASLAGEGELRKRLSWIEREIGQNPLLQDVLESAHRTERVLAEIIIDPSRRDSYRRTAQRTSLLVAYSFVAMFVKIYDRLSGVGRRKLLGRLRDGLKADYGLAPLIHELTVAAHLLRKGFDILCSDLDDLGRCDFVARGPGVQFEIECKLVGPDKGQPVHRRHAMVLLDALREALRPITEQIGGGHFVRVTLRNRLSANREVVDRIVADALGAMNGDRERVSACELIEVERFDVQGTPFAVAQPEAAAVGDFLLHRFGVEDKHLVYAVNPISTLVVVVQSQQPVRVIAGVHKELRDSAKSQFSRQRPGIFVVQLYGLSEADLLELAQQGRDGKTAIKAMAFDLFARESWAHIHTLAFMSQGSIDDAEIRLDGQVLRAQSVSGPVHSFRNPKHPEALNPKFGIY